MLYRGGYLADPASHDFNADLYCGGDPSLWSGLLTLDASFTPAADWAIAWEVSTDATLWVFRLRRDNSGWSNGDPVVAQDFVWSWQRLVDPKTGAPHAWLLQDIVNADAIRRSEMPPERLGVRATDNWTLEVQLVGPHAHFAAIAASPGTVPAHRATVEQFGDQWTEAVNIVSNGPFQLSVWEHGVRFETIKNPGHWSAGMIGLAHTVVPILSVERKSQPFFNNLVDFLPVQADDLAHVRDIASLGGTLDPAIEPAIWFIIPNPALPPFDDVRVRRAAALALDPERMLQISGGQAMPAQSLMPLGWPFHFDDADLAALQHFDVDQALRSLAGTPFTGGRNWPPVTLSLSNSDPAARQLAQDIAAQLGENLGMTVEVRALAADAFEKAVSDRTSNLYWYRWDFTYADPNNGYGDAFFAPNSSRTRLLILPEGYRGLVERASSEQSRTTRMALYRECERLLQNDVAYIPVAYPTTFYLVRPWLLNLPTTASDTVIPPSLLFTRFTSFASVKGRPGS